MLFPSFDIHEVVRHDFSPRDDTDSTEFYCNVLSQLGEKILQKEPELLCNCATMTQSFMGKKTQSSFATSCTSQICLCAISFFFPETKIKLKNDHFDTVKGFQGSVK